MREPEALSSSAPGSFPGNSKVRVSVLFQSVVYGIQTDMMGPSPLQQSHSRKDQAYAESNVTGQAPEGYGFE
jgi:hypothetical protein